MPPKPLWSVAVLLLGHGTGTLTDVPSHEVIEFTPGGGHLSYTGGDGGPDAPAVLIASIAGYPDWVVEATFRGSAEVAELRVYPKGATFTARARARGALLAPSSGTPAGGVPTRLLRQINVGELVDLARRKSAEMAGALTPSTNADPEVRAYFKRVARSSRTVAAAPRRPGKQGYDIEHYLIWATRYAEKVQAGSRSPIADLAKQHLKALGGDPDKARVWVRDTIRDARSRHKLLTDPGQGRAGGDLTPKAIELLTEKTAQEGN